MTAIDELATGKYLSLTTFRRDGTPVATPVNLMVMGPAGYRFGDYWKLGLPLLGVTFVVAVFVVPLIWPL